MWQIGLSVVVIVFSLFMSFKRFRSNEPGYGALWLACAGVNLYYFLGYVLPAG